MPPLYEHYPQDEQPSKHQCSPPTPCCSPPILYTHQGESSSTTALCLISRPPPLPSANALRSSRQTRHSVDAHLVMILAVLLSVLMCALFINAIVRCALRRTNRVAIESGRTQQQQSGSGSGAANTGIKRAALKEFPTISYSQGLALTLPGLDSTCAICLCDFAKGVRVRVLPTCNHGFHVRCIAKWLASHSSCPTCRQCLLDVGHEITSRGREDCGPQRVLAPLDAEGLLIDYRT